MFGSSFKIVVSATLRNGIRRPRYLTSGNPRRPIPLQGNFLDERREFSVKEGTKLREKRPSKNNPKKRKSDPMAEFLYKVQRKEVSQNLICQQAEELLLQLLQHSIRPEDGRGAMKLLDIAIENANLPSERLLPRLFSLACQMMLQSGDRGALTDMNTQLLRLLDNHKSYLTEDIEFSSHHVNDACAQFIIGAVVESNKAKCGLPKHRQDQIQHLMNRLDELYCDASVPLVANGISCNAFIMFHCSRQRPDEALKLLHWMVDTLPTHPVDLTPRVNSFTATISAFAKVNPEKSMEVLQWMLNLYECGIGPAPNSSCFNALLAAWANSGRRDAGTRAEQILEWMQQLHDTKGLETSPDVVSWNSAIRAWGNTPATGAAERAEAMLRQMITRFEAGGAVVPENVSFISVMNAWANSGKRESPDRVSRLLDLMKAMAQGSDSLFVDSYAYSVLLKAYENTDRSVTRQKSDESVVQILRVLDQMYHDGVEVTPAIHNSIIMALCNFSSLSAVLYFLEVEERYRKGNAAINVRTFNSGLSVMAILNKQDASERAVDILDRMTEYSKTDPSVAPDQTTSNVILKILSRSPSAGAAARADDILAEMESQKYFESSQAGYVTVIIAWGRSNDTAKFGRVKALLDRYRAKVASRAITNSSLPNVYNAALSVCRHNSELATKPQAVETLLYTLDMLRQDESVNPDETTYLTLFQAVDCLLDDENERHELLEREIAFCIKDGKVSKPMADFVWKACPALFSTLFGENETPQTVKIPHAWSKSLRTSRT